MVYALPKPVRYQFFSSHDASGPFLNMSPRFLLLLLLVIPCLSHKRLYYPVPRSTNTGPTANAPCGGISFDRAYGQGHITNWNAGDTVTIIIYEEQYHSGEPIRLTISGSNNDNFDCIWLNHIPQHVRGTQNGGRNLTIQMTVPDMICTNCTLQMIGFQVGNRNDDTCCAYNSNATKTCGVEQYYSCSNININGGTRSRSDVCVQPDGWAYRGYKCNYYRQEASASAWDLDSDINDDKTLKLKVSGNVDGRPDESDFCEESNLQIAVSNECQRTATDFSSLSLLEGGDMQTDGYIAIILVVVLSVAITVTYYIAKKKGINNNNINESDNF